MKKVSFLLLGFLLTFNLAQAQEEGLKLAKAAAKALTAYNIDPQGNSDKLQEARDKIEQAVKLPDAQAVGSTWQTKGDIYNTTLQRDLARRMIDPKAPLTGDNDALVAFDAYKKAYELGVKKFEKSDAVKGIEDVTPHVINSAVAKYELKEYEKSFNAFRASVEAHDILKANEKKSPLDDPKQLEDQIYFTGLIATMAGKCSDALPFFERLYKAGTNNPAVYEGIYNCRMEMKDEAAANIILTEGRKKFPDDTALLFAEINAYLKAGKLSELTGRLEEAIAKEPTNVSLYVTLGNVYDNLYQGALKEKNDADATRYFDLAKQQYEGAIKQNPNYLDANYSLGALYYNRAAVRTQEMNTLPEDYSAAGLKKMESMRNEVISLFDQALPYFQMAESIDANDINTLIALNEIYARKDDEVLSPEFKKRLETVKGGGKNTATYFDSKVVSKLISQLMSQPKEQVIQMVKLPGGLYEIPCEINGLPLKLIFDTGASDVSISLAEAVFMLKNKHMSEADILGTQKYSIANGDIQEGTKVVLRKLVIGGVSIENVEASIVHSLKAPLLLGQSAIKKLGIIQIDPNLGTLTIKKN